MQNVTDPMPRSSPYVWPTWISKLMAAEQQCRYASWFKAHFTYEKLPSDFNLAKWSAEHGDLVQRRAQELRDLGYVVYVEEANAFRVVGKSGAILSCKPDIVAVKGDEVRVVDCKTGQQRNSDAMQVLLYMYLLPLRHGIPSCVGKQVVGEIVYRNATVEIPADAVDDAFKQRFADTMGTVVAAAPPEPAPGYRGCQYCDIGAALCPARIDEPPKDAEVDLF